MCFSAEVSFGMGAVLGVIGVVAIKKAKEPKQVPFAAIPLLFATQQFAEGFLWVGLTAPVNSILTYWSLLIFLGFSQIFWPIWIPFSIYLLEKRNHLRKVLAILMGVGGVVSIYFFYCLLVSDFSAQIESRHIHYQLDFPEVLVWPSAVLYFVPLVFSPFFSGWKGMKLLGSVNLFSFLMTVIFYEEFLISVWCFFAAIMSILILDILSKNLRHRLLTSIPPNIRETAGRWSPFKS
jgi:hypothetical protein